jgi:hypothetical protein
MPASSIVGKRIQAPRMAGWGWSASIGSGCTCDSVWETEELLAPMTNNQMLLSCLH